MTTSSNSGSFKTVLATRTMVDLYGDPKGSFSCFSGILTHTIIEACLQQTLKPCAGDRKSFLSITRPLLRLPITWMLAAALKPLSDFGWSAAQLGAEMKAHK